MNLTKSKLDEQHRIFEEGIDKAIEHIKLIHISTLLDIPDDIRERLYKATDEGTLVVTQKGDVEFLKHKE